MVFLLETFEPVAAVDLVMTIGSSNAVGEEQCLIADHVIIQGQALPLVIPCPVGQGLFDIWKFALGLPNWRSTAVVRI